MLFTVTLPKPRLAGFAPNVPGVTPVPVSGMVKLGFAALEVITTFPVTLPAEVGANLTVNVVLWLGASVIGAVMPLSVKPVPPTLTWEIVTLVPPELVTVSDSD